LSAAGDKAEFLYSKFADVKMPQFNSSQLVPNIVRMALSYICQRAKTTVVLVVCCSQQPEIRWLPHMDIGNPPFRAPFGARQVHKEDLNLMHVIRLFRSFCSFADDSTAWVIYPEQLP
jgi:hypothetical protein